LIGLKLGDDTMGKNGGEDSRAKKIRWEFFTPTATQAPSLFLAGDE